MDTGAHQKPLHQSRHIDNLRELRRKAREVYRDLKSDLEAFQQLDGTFSTTPPPKEGRIHVTTTCTALMALGAAHKIDELCPPTSKDKALLTVFQHVVSNVWKSEGLEPDNAFTVALVLRAAGLLVNEKKLGRDVVVKLQHGGSSLESLAKTVLARAGKDFSEAFGVRIASGDKSAGEYPPKTAIVYWFVHGIDLLGIEIDAQGWETLVHWGTRAFNQQVAFVASNDDALMDPVSMAMAACLVSRLQKMLSRRDTDDALAQLLPSKTALNHSISLLFKHQTPSGIWPKYFPMFHFLNAGANYCFTFEMLEALVGEMEASQLFEIPSALDGLRRAVKWCVVNRLQYRAGDEQYCGWNSGGSITTLLASQPESWATATVHWFLHELDKALSFAIESKVLEKYRVTRPRKPDAKEWDRIADAPVEIQSVRETVKGVLTRQFLNPFVARDERLSIESRRSKIETRRSALLFGPPGTAKTTLVRRLAEAIGWPCVQIRPSDFLRRGLDNIYLVANEIFDDLMDLSGTLIFFDEMDALVQSRNIPLDATRQFLTTSMLPKLDGLHDEGRSIFFFATNHRATFDDAIIRPGRFDLLLLVGTPSWQEKLNKLPEMVVSTPLGHGLTQQLNGEERQAAFTEMTTRFKRWAQEEDLGDKLGRFTYGETKSLFEELLKNTDEKSSLTTAAGLLQKEAFVQAVQTWATKYIILREVGSAEKPNDNYTNYLVDLSASRWQ